MERYQKNSTVYIRIICAILFWAFSFIYLYVYQADILVVSQHILSNGKTHYDKDVGTFLITLSLFVLHIGVLGITRLTRTWHALTYFPSLLLLTVITSISPYVGKTYDLNTSLFVFLFILLVYVIGIVLIKKIEPYHVESENGFFFSSYTWSNLLTMGLMFAGVGFWGNDDELFHYRMRVENYLLQKNYQRAIEVGKTSPETDSSLVMLRAFALSQTNGLGEHLFEYPLKGGSLSLLPDGKNVKMLLYPEDRLYQSLGTWIPDRKSPRHYFEVSARRHREKRAVDYLLCACLLDKDLNAFVTTLKHYYPQGKELPKHFQEALILYGHLRGDTQTVSGLKMNATFENYQELLRKYPNEPRRRNAVRKYYGGSYWYYYQYVDS